jgi:phosphate-selective porin OprO/OprP
MMENRVLLGTSCVLALLAALPAVAQQPSLEDRVRTLEQMLGVPPPAGNQSLEDRVKAVEDALAQQNAQKEEADQMVRTRLSTLEQQVAETTISIDNSRPTISSADGRFQLSLRARIQFDGAFFSQDSNINATNAQFKDLASGAIVRRFYFGAEGRAFRDFWYEFRMDFGGANAEGNNAIINLARVAYNFGNLNNPNELHFRINAGIIQPLFTYGDSVSSSSTTFIERGDVVNTTIAGYGGDDHRRGVELTFQQSDIFRPGDNLVLSSAFTGQPTTPPAGAPTNTTDEGTQIVGRAAYRFWSDGFSNFQFGGNFAHIFNMTGTAVPGGARSVPLQDRPEIRVDGNRLVSTVNSTLLGSSAVAANIPERGGWLWGLEGGGNWRNFYLYGEYMKFGMDRDVMCTGCTPFGGTPGVNPGDPEFSGWYAEGSWILTGESKTYSAFATNNEMATFNNPRVITPFDWNGGSWGAWEIAARYSNLDFNWRPGVIGQTPAQAPVGGIRGGDEKIWTFGINWYMNNNVLMRFNYLIVDVNKLGFVTTAGTTTLQEIGQNFSALGLRLQFTN